MGALWEDREISDPCSDLAVRSRRRNKHARTEEVRALQWLAIEALGRLPAQLSNTVEMTRHAAGREGEHWLALRQLWLTTQDSLSLLRRHQSVECTAPYQTRLSR